MFNDNRRLTKILVMNALAFSLSLSINAQAKNPDPLGDIVKTKPIAVNLKSSPFFEGRGDGIKTCPVTGEKISNQAYQLQHAGRTFLFCCKGCWQKAKSQPDKYLKTTAAEQDQAVRAYLAKAPKPADGEEYCNE